MNVYSLKFLPSLKLKFCDLFGIASVPAVEQLQARVDRLEITMDRFDKKLKSNAAKRKIASQQKLLTKFNTQPAVPAEPTVAASSSTLLKAAEEPREVAVVLVQPDEETKKVVREYFSQDTDLIELKKFEDLEASFTSHQVLALFFDRMLLGQEKSREILEKLGRDFPKTRMIGLSSYLTLAISKSLPQHSDFATFVTKPISRDSLAEVIEEKEIQNIKSEAKSFQVESRI